MPINLFDEYKAMLSYTSMRNAEICGGPKNPKFIEDLIR